jgi:hypothetical protein
VIIRRRRSPLAPHDRAFLDFATGLVDSHRLASALADTPINAEDMAVDGEPGYVWAQALHGDVLVALGHPDQAIRRAQWDHCHMCGAPQTLAEVLGSTELVVLGTAESPVPKPGPRSSHGQRGTWRLPEVSSRAPHRGLQSATRLALLGTSASLNTGSSGAMYLAVSYWPPSPVSGPFHQVFRSAGWGEKPGPDSACRPAEGRQSEYHGMTMVVVPREVGKRGSGVDGMG